MHKILIADDLLADREKLKEELQNLSELNIEIVNESQNGKEAVEYLFNNHVDIIITDIEMPICNGFELIKQARRIIPNVKVIFCSLYDEFEYAKKAVYFDSYGYVLKPIDKMELKICLENIIAKIDEKADLDKKNEKYNKMIELVDNYKEVWSKDFIKNLLLGEFELNESQALEQQSFLQIGLNEAYYGVCLFSIDDYSAMMKTNTILSLQVSTVKISEKIQNLLNSNNIRLAKTSENFFAAIVNSSCINELENDVMRYCNLVVENFSRSDISITATYASFARQLTEIKTLYNQCVYQMKYQFSLGKSIVISPENIPNNIAECRVLNFNDLLNDFRFLVYGANESQIMEYFENFFNDLIHQEINDAKNTLLYISVCLQIILNESKLELDKELSAVRNISADIMQSKSIFDIKNTIINMTLLSNKVINDKSQDKSKMVVLKVKTFIENNLSVNFNMEDISRELFYSPNHLNKIFKKETGQSVLEYTQDFKVEKAKEMLKDFSIKFYQITEILGYTNPAYFSSIFKKKTGITPKEYRDKILFSAEGSVK